MAAEGTNGTVDWAAVEQPIEEVVDAGAEVMERADGQGDEEPAAVEGDVGSWEEDGGVVPVEEDAGAAGMTEDAGVWDGESAVDAGCEEAAGEGGEEGWDYAGQGEGGDDGSGWQEGGDEGGGWDEGGNEGGDWDAGGDEGGPGSAGSAWCLLYFFVVWGTTC